MGIIKKSSSGRALQFITDEGVVYQLAASLFSRVVDGRINGDFVVLTRMPIPVPSDRFPRSPLYGDNGLDSAVSNGGSDAFDRGFLSERKEQRVNKRASEFKVKW